MKKLKRKFIIVSMASILIAATLILGVLTFVGYHNLNQELKSTLEYITENDGTMPEVTDGTKDFKDATFNPESAFSTRYFSLRISADGNLIDSDLDHIASISVQDGIELYEKISQSKSDFDIYTLAHGSSYAYLKTTYDTGETLIVFMDCTRARMLVRRNIMSSLRIGIASMIVLIIVFIYLSGKYVQDKLRAAEAQKTFITNASHELKTPLAVISANTEVMEMLNGKNEWTESNLKQIKRMSELITRLVTLSKIEEKEKLVLETVDYTHLAEETAKDYRTVIEADDKAFTTDIQANVTVTADEKGLQELINILVDNGNKYCDESGKVTLSLSKKGKTTRLIVSNDYKDGDGVDYSRFFERFYREDESHNNEKKGFGIGLSMAESLVEKFHGKIKVEYKDKIISFIVTI